MSNQNAQYAASDCLLWLLQLLPLHTLLIIIILLSKNTWYAASDCSVWPPQLLPLQYSADYFSFTFSIKMLGISPEILLFWHHSILSALSQVPQLT